MNRKTNIQLVTNMMEFSRRGALAQIFIMSAIESYATYCASTDPAQFESNFICGAAWVDTGKEILEKLEANREYA